MTQIHELTLEESTKKIVEYSFDCVWIYLPVSKTDKMQSELLQVIDWKLGGFISRLLQDGKTENQTTFIPSMKRIPSPLVALDLRDSFEIENFRTNLEGLKPKSVCCIAEDEKDLQKIKKQVEKLKLTAPIEVLEFAV